MSVSHVVTRGYGNGTLVGTIALVVTRGYAIGEVDLTNLFDNDDTPTAANLIDNDTTPTAANLIDVT